MPHDALGTDHHETRVLILICQFVVRDAEQKYIEEHYSIHDKFPKVALKYSKSEFVSYNFGLLFDNMKLFKNLCCFKIHYAL